MSKTNAKTPANKSKQAPSIKPLRTATCPTLSGKATLTYDVGQDASKGIHFRVTANDGGGFFSSEYVVWKDIEVAIYADEPVTSICLRSLFKGKSVNTSEMMSRRPLVVSLRHFCHWLIISTRLDFANYFQDFCDIVPRYGR